MNESQYFEVDIAKLTATDLMKMATKYNEMIDKIKQLEQDKQKLLDHAKWLHDCLDEMPCELCEEMELAKQVREK